MGFQSEGVSSQGAELEVEVGAGTPATVTGATSANPSVLTATNTLVDGDVVRLSAFSAAWAVLNGKSSVVDAAGPSSFTADGIDASDIAAYSANGGSATPVDFANACEVRNFNGFDGQASELDITTLCSLAKEYRPGLQDFGSFNFSMNYVPTDAAQLAMQNAKAAGASIWFRLMLPGSFGSWVFLAFVRQMTISGGVDAPLSSDVVLRITGAPTYVA